MLSGGSVSPWRSGVEEGRSPLGRFRKPEPCFPRTYATWDAKKDENRFESMKFRLRQRFSLVNALEHHRRTQTNQDTAAGFWVCFALLRITVQMGGVWCAAW